VAFGAPEDAAPTLLEDGVVLRTRMERGQAVWVARVDVPEGVEGLAVVVSGETDVDLYLRRGRPSGGDLAEESDASSRSPSLQEVVSLTPFSETRVVPGTWYVTVENPTARVRGVELEVVAFVDGRDGPRTLLPGRPVSAALPGAGGRLALRTFLPRRARSLDLALRAREPQTVRFQLRGPDGYLRQGPGIPRLLLSADEGPPGVYELSLESAAGAPDRRVGAETSWDLGPGRRLPGEGVPYLEPGETATVLLGGEGNPENHAVRVSVPRGMGGFVVTASVPDGTTADVDLYVRRDRELIEPDQDADYLGLSSASGGGTVERLVVGTTLRRSRSPSSGCPPAAPSGPGGATRRRSSPRGRGSPARCGPRPPR
jgi:hypothetical protein